MGLIRKQKVGEGMFICGNGKNIEITILEISGMEFHRKVRLEIDGIRNLPFLELSADKGYFRLTKDIKLRVSNGSDYEEDDKGTSVFMNYDASKKHYKMDRKEYDKKEIAEDFDEQPPWVVNSNHPVGFYYKEEFEKYIKKRV